jgi:hypothetical protein
VSDTISESSANYVLLTRLADEVAARYRAGERPALQEYLDRYPHLADDLRELFPAMVEIEQVSGIQREPCGSPTSRSPRPRSRTWLLRREPVSAVGRIPEDRYPGGGPRTAPRGRTRS